MARSFSIPLGPRSRKALKIAGYVLLGLVSFVYALHLTFPYDRVKDKGVEALSSRYEVTVGGVERGWLPGDFSLTSVQLRTRPSKPGEVPKLIAIDRLDVDVRLFASLFSAAAVVDLDARIGPGHITGTIELGGGRTKLALDSRSLPLSEVPGLSSVVGLPMAGNGTVTARLDLPGGDWRRASARFVVDCPTCTIGGDGVKIKPRTMTGAKAAWVGEGIEVPRMFIDRLQAELVIENGKFAMKRWTAVSPDGDLIVELSGTVERTLSASKIETGCIQFRGTDALAQREPKFHGSLDLIGGVLMPDGLRHLKVTGTLGGMRDLPKACDGSSGGDVGGGDAGAGGRARPSLSNVPDAPSDGNGAAGPGGPPGTVQPAPSGDVIDAAPTPKIDDVRPGVDTVAPAGTDPAAAGTGTGAPPGTDLPPGTEPPPPPPPEGAPPPGTEGQGSPGPGDSAGPDNGPPPVELKEVPPENE
jgi:type II secretion system protein N